MNRPIAAMLAFVLLLAPLGVVLAADAPAKTTGDGATSGPAPPITIVREGGMAEEYRREGADFAAYGPEEAEAGVDAAGSAVEDDADADAPESDNAETGNAVPQAEG